jgi:hypothetical protein
MFKAKLISHINMLGRAMSTEIEKHGTLLTERFDEATTNCVL